MRFLIISGLLLTASAAAQSARSTTDPWTLPSNLTVKQDGPQSWRFLCDYYNLDTKGRTTGRERYSAIYTRGLPGDVARWNDVSVAVNSDGSDKFPPAQKRDFMEGFSYPHEGGVDNSKPEFFRGFPASAIKERNLIWDTVMIEVFGQKLLDHLELNKPYHIPDTGDMALAGLGSFQNKDVQLVWTGNSKRNDVDCAVVDYRAFFNHFEVNMGAIKLVGRSHYWGQIWVSLSTRHIEYASLYEDVLGELKLPGQEKPMIINVFRIGSFEPVAAVLTNRTK